jgi:hypothetical protein
MRNPESYWNTSIVNPCSDGAAQKKIWQLLAQNELPSSIEDITLIDLTQKFSGVLSW